MWYCISEAQLNETVIHKQTCYTYFFAKTCILRCRNHDFWRRTCFLHLKMTGHGKSIVLFLSKNGWSFLTERVIIEWRWWHLIGYGVNLASLFNDFLRIRFITKCRNRNFLGWCSFPKVYTLCRRRCLPVSFLVEAQIDICASAVRSGLEETWNYHGGNMELPRSYVGAIA